MTEKQLLIYKIESIGFRQVESYKFYDLLNFRLYFSDGVVVFIKFDHITSKTVAAKSTIDMSHGYRSIINAIKGLMR